MAQKDENEDGSGAEMSFLQHLEVLRWHLIRSAFAILVFAIAAFIYMQEIFELVLLAPKSSDFITFRLMCRFSQEVMGNDAMCMASTDINLINTDISGQFSNHLYVSLVAGIVFAFPYVLWEIWRFIRPALRENEAKSATGIIFWCSLLFFIKFL